MKIIELNLYPLNKEIEHISRTLIFQKLAVDVFSLHNRFNPVQPSILTKLGIVGLWQSSKATFRKSIVSYLNKVMNFGYRPNKEIIENKDYQARPIPTSFSKIKLIKFCFVDKVRDPSEPMKSKNVCYWPYILVQGRKERLENRKLMFIWE